MSMIAQLAVAAAVYAIDRPYSYRVPEDMPLAAGPTSCNEPPAYRQPPMAQTKRRRTFVREVRRRGFIFCANGATVIRHTRLRSETSLSAWRPFSAITSPVLTGLSVRKINIPFPASRNE